MKTTITVSGYNRPAYLRRTLEALVDCIGVADASVMVLLDPCDRTAEQADLCQSLGIRHLVFSEHAGCNRSIFNSLRYGFDVMSSEFHVHLEDDTVPTKDALSWFAWARDAYGKTPAVFSVSGYQRLSNGKLDECGCRRWFTPWGWGIWRDRWAGCAAGWAADEKISWDVIVNHVLRAGRYEAFPTVSRIQNIGAELGTHVPSAEWHAANHHVAETADDIAGDRPGAWGEVRIDEHADHA